METEKAEVTGSVFLILENQGEVDNLVKTLKEWMDGDTTAEARADQEILVANIIQLLEAE